MINKEEMLKKIKLRLGYREDDAEPDAMLQLMLEDTMTAIILFCNRKMFPWELESVARQMVVNAFQKENGDNVAAIKRGDTQITYINTITVDAMTPEQRELCYKFRKFKMA